MAQKRYLLKTLGCKANLYDSQLIEAELQKRGWIAATHHEADTADLCIVNSCTVTDEADRQSRKIAQKMAKENTGTKVVFTGCGAEVEPEQVAATPGINYVVGNRDKPTLVDLVLRAIDDPKSENGILGRAENYEALLSRHPMDREWAAPESAFLLPPAHLRGEAGRTRSFLKIQEGCNSFCTYCVIPYGRGPSRSLPISNVISQIQDLVAQGMREVVITGTNIGDYGSDLGFEPGVADLFKQILDQTKLERLRVSSLDPTEITPELIALMKSDPRFCPHFHVSLQSPHSRVLKLMKRKYAFEQVQECLEQIAEIPAPIGGVYVGMDVITGFPGEGEDEFQWGYEALKALPWTRLHVFPYSERDGTPATRLPHSVPQSKRVQRAHALRELSLQRLNTVHQSILEDYRSKQRVLSQVLLEGPVKGPSPEKVWVPGYTPNYVRVLIPVNTIEEARALQNQLVSVEPISVVSDSTAGDLAVLGSVIRSDIRNV